MLSCAALAGLRSYARQSITCSPPGAWLMSSARLLPARQLSWPTISCTMPARSGDLIGPRVVLPLSGFVQVTRCVVSGRWSGQSCAVEIVRLWATCPANSTATGLPDWYQRFSVNVAVTIVGALRYAYVAEEKTADMPDVERTAHADVWKVEK